MALKPGIEEAEERCGWEEDGREEELGVGDVGGLGYRDRGVELLGGLGGGVREWW